MKPLIEFLDGAAEDMPSIDLLFPVIGNQVPADHAYPLYSALVGNLPALHNGDFGPAIASITGQYLGNGLFAINGHSYLRIRLPSEQIAALLPLAGKALVIAGHRVRVGVPRVVALTPAPALIARLVTIKGFTEPGPFVEAARRQLDELKITGEAGIPLITTGPRTGQPRRRILRIKDKRVVGFSLQVTALTAEESITLQEHGLGGRRRMGCGFFLPIVLKDAK
jgi:CRISPR-associated protein Cas6